MSGDSTKIMAYRGATWATTGIGVQRAIQTLSLLALARLLVPEDFGLVAIAALVLNLISRAKTLGLLTSLIQYKGEIATGADACFIINGILSLVSIGLLLAVSPLISGVFDPRAGWLTATMSLGLLPQALAAVPATLAVRELQFRKQALIQAAEGIVGAVVAVALALAGCGPWALVAGFLVGSTSSAILWWVRPQWVPTWRFDRQVASELMHAGIRIWSAGNLLYLVDGANRLFIGSMLGISQLGNYELISKIVHVPIQTVTGIHDRVAVSAFCREHDDPARIGRWFLRLSGILLILTSLVAGPLFCFPDILIPTVFGEGWEAAIEPARALALFALLAPLVSTPPIYIAIRRTSLLLKYTMVRTVVTVIALFAAAHISLTMVCSVESLGALVFAPINVFLVARMTGLGARSIFSTLSVPLVGLGAYLMVAFAIRSAVNGSLSTPGVAALAVLVFLPAAALALAVLAMRPRVVSEIRLIVSETVGTR